MSSQRGMALDENVSLTQTSSRKFELNLRGRRDMLLLEAFFIYVEHTDTGRYNVHSS